MRIRQFRGRSLEKIYSAIEDELGANAVIVSNRREEGMKSMLGGAAYEVIAVVDDESADRHARPPAVAPEEFKKISALQNEMIRQMEHTFSELKSDIRGLSKRATPASEPDGDRPAFMKYWDRRFVRMLQNRHPTFMTTDTREQQLETLTEVLPVVEDFKIRRGRTPQIFVLAGPTGSGKTTTAAKLASRWSLSEHLKVGLISIDTFRVGAVDQLREYATLLGVELKVAFSPSEAARAVAAFSNKDVILVDTAGRSHYDQTAIKALQGFVVSMGPSNVMLTIPATWDRTSVGEMISNYKVVSPSYLIVTKTDEARGLDLVTVAASETTAPIAFLTNGQRVPQDICVARAEDVADMLVPKEDMQ